MVAARTGASRVAKKLRKLNRRLVIVDIENMVGQGEVTENAATWTANEVRKLVGDHQRCLVVIGTSHSMNRFHAQVAWPNARHVSHYGTDGADRALVEVLEEDVAVRFSEIICFSGDSAFAEPLDKLASEVAVTAYARKGSLSQKLQTSSVETRYLPTEYQPPPNARVVPLARPVPTSKPKRPAAVCAWEPCERPAGHTRTAKRSRLSGYQLVG